MKASVRSMIYHSGQNEDGTCVVGNAGCDWAVSGDGGYHYSIWALTKGLGQYIPPDSLLSDPTNWYDKVVDLLLSQQGADGSWPQDGRDDATTIGATSFAVSALGLVGIQQQAASLTLAPRTASNPTGTAHTVTATAKDAAGNPVAGASVVFSVTGANSAGKTLTTDANGNAKFAYTGTNQGADTISAFADNNKNGKLDPGEPQRHRYQGVVRPAIGRRVRDWRPQRRRWH